MAASALSDEQLIRGIEHGDEEALGQLIRRYTPYVSTIIWNIIAGKLTEADLRELVSDSFLALWQTAERIQPGKLKAYLGSIARHRAINALRQSGRTLALEENTVLLTLPGPEDELLRQEEYAALCRALNAMGEPDRTIFIRHYYACQSVMEIAEAMGISKFTIYTKLRRGREKLRQCLTEGGF